MRGDYRYTASAEWHAASPGVLAGEAGSVYVMKACRFLLVDMTECRSRELFILPEVRGWKRAYKEGREQHNIRQGKLAFGAFPHLGQRRTLRERGRCC